MARRRLAEPLGLRALLGGDEDDVEPAAGERRRGLAGDGSGADDHGAGAGSRRAQRKASSTVRTVCRPRILRAVDRRSVGGRAGGEHAGVVGQLMAALEVHAASRAIEARPPRARGAASPRARRTSLVLEGQPPRARARRAGAPRQRRAP